MKKIMTTAVFSVMLASGAFAQQKLDLQAHRGGMALMPENTVSSMLNGVKIGARTLELDVLITSDGKVVVSHDPYMSSVIMRKADGTDVTKAEEKSMALYKMTYDSISHFDSGSKPHPYFPDQHKLKTHKPLLADLIDSVEAYVKLNKLKPVYYNIETKTTPEGDGIYHPKPDVFVATMMDVINKKGITKRVTIQSFDVRTLQVMHQTQPKVKLSLLIANKESVADNIKKLGFIPQVYSPYYTLVDAQMIRDSHVVKMEVLPWTVDQEKDMKALNELGVDGMISNYPDRLVKIFGSYQ